MQFLFKIGTLTDHCGYPYKENGNVGVLTVPAKQINERLVKWAHDHIIYDKAVINRILSVSAEPTMLNCNGMSLEYDRNDHTWWLVVDRNADVLASFGCEVLDFDDVSKVLILKENAFSRSIHSPSEPHRGRPRKEVAHDDVWQDVYAMSKELAHYLYQMPVTKLYTDQNTKSVFVITSKYEKPSEDIPSGWALVGRSDTLFKFQHK